MLRSMDGDTRSLPTQNSLHQPATLITAFTFFRE
jgi:hypothetical protein